MRGVLTMAMLFGASTAFAHPGHTQVTELEWNDQTSRFEVAMQLDAVALEDSVSLWKGTRFRLESAQSVDETLAEWLPRGFQILSTSAMQSGSVKWVGYELELHTVWLFFEYVPAPARASKQAGNKETTNQRLAPYTALLPDGIAVENKCLFDVRPDASHLISLRSGTAVQQQHCDKLRPRVEFKSSSDRERRLGVIRRPSLPTMPRSRKAR